MTLSVRSVAITILPSTFVRSANAIYGLRYIVSYVLHTHTETTLTHTHIHMYVRYRPKAM